MPAHRPRPKPPPMPASGGRSTPQRLHCNASSKNIHCIRSVATDWPRGSGSSARTSSRYAKFTLPHSSLGHWCSITQCITMVSAVRMAGCSHLGGHCICGSSSGGGSSGSSRNASDVCLRPRIEGADLPVAVLHERGLWWAPARHATPASHACGKVA